MKHLFNVTGDGNIFLAKSHKHADQTVHQIWSLQQELVQGLVVESCAAIEDHSDLFWFFRVMNIEM